jgi:hypothetical protein
MAGGAALFLVGGVVSHVMREVNLSSFNDHKPPCGMAENGTISGGSDCESLYEGAKSWRTGMIVGYVGAGALGALATYLILTAPPRPTAPEAARVARTRWACAPFAAGSTVDLTCVARF